MEDAVLPQIARRAPGEHAVLLWRSLFGVPEHLDEGVDVIREDLQDDEISGEKNGEGEG